MVRYRDIMAKRAYSWEALKNDTGLGGVADKELIGTAAGAALGGVGGSFIPYLWTKDPGRGARMLSALGGALGGGLITNSLMDKDRLRNEQYGNIFGDAWRNKWAVLPYAGGAGAYAALSAGANSTMAQTGAARLATQALLKPGRMSADKLALLSAAKDTLLNASAVPLKGPTALAQNEALRAILEITKKTPHDARVLGATAMKGIPSTWGETGSRLLYKANHLPQNSWGLLLKLLRKGR